MRWIEASGHQRAFGGVSHRNEANERIKIQIMRTACRDFEVDQFLLLMPSRHGALYNFPAILTLPSIAIFLSWAINRAIHAIAASALEGPVATGPANAIGMQIAGGMEYLVSITE